MQSFKIQIVELIYILPSKGQRGFAAELIHFDQITQPFMWNTTRWPYLMGCSALNAELSHGYKADRDLHHFHVPTSSDGAGVSALVLNANTQGRSLSVSVCMWNHNVLGSDKWARNRNRHRMVLLRLQMSANRMHMWNSQTKCENNNLILTNESVG